MSKIKKSLVIISISGRAGTEINCHAIWRLLLISVAVSGLLRPLSVRLTSGIIFRAGITSLT